jgi:alkaline phosphatase D
MKKYLLLLIVCISTIKSKTQIISGPMLGHLELRTAKIWVEVKPNSNLECYVWEKGNTATVTKALKTINNNLGFETITFEAVNLKFNTAYAYNIIPAVSKKPIYNELGNFKTLDFWTYNNPVPNITLLAGSCNYVNQPPYDRKYSDMIKLNKLATSYGGDSSIFSTMAATPANAMLWLGDNWYTREADYHSAWGLNARASNDRKSSPIQALLKAMPNYATWDDHDFGPNDCDKSYQFSNESRDAFKRFWANPTYGDGQKGIYTKFSIADCEIFVLDDRTWRSNDNMSDSINGMPNMEKRMFGFQQMDWLKNALLASKANFKIIMTGSQMLNPVSPFDCFRKFPAEYLEFMEFIAIEKINGILFFTGDRHHSEVIKIDRPNAYPLYDVTISPLTSGTHKFGGAEKNNPYRVYGLDQLQNFGEIKVTGTLDNRNMTITFKGVKGENLGSWSVNANDLKFGK